MPSQWTKWKVPGFPCLPSSNNHSPPPLPPSPKKIKGLRKAMCFQNFGHRVRLYRSWDRRYWKGHHVKKSLNSLSVVPKHWECTGGHRLTQY